MVLAPVSDVGQNFDVTKAFCRSKAALISVPVESEEMQTDHVVLVSDDEHEPYLQHDKEDGIHISPVSKFSDNSKMQMANIDNENSSKIRLFYQMARLYLKRECSNVGCRQINNQIRSLEQRCERHDLLFKCATRDHANMERRIELVSAENAQLKEDKWKANETKLQMDLVIRHQQKTICEQDAKLDEMNKLRVNLLPLIPTSKHGQSPYNQKAINAGVSRASVTKSCTIPSSRSTQANINHGVYHGGSGTTVSTIDKQQIECLSTHIPYPQFSSSINGHTISNSTRNISGVRKNLSQSSRVTASFNGPISRMVIEVPLLDSLKEINEPKTVPPLDYPVELRQIRLKSGRGNLEILIHTQVADFHLSNKIQGVIRYPKNIGEKSTRTICLYYYMESTVVNRKLEWMSGPVCICRSTGSTKFCLHFHKDQKISRCDRVVIFVYMFSDIAKYVSDRAMFQFAPLQIQSFPSTSSISNSVGCCENSSNAVDSHIQSPIQKFRSEENFQVYRPRF